MKASPAGMDRAHGRWRKVWVVFNGDCLLNMVLADVLVHLLHSQRLPVLRNATVPYRLLLNTFAGCPCLTMTTKYLEYFSQVLLQLIYSLFRCQTDIKPHQRSMWPHCNNTYADKCHAGHKCHQSTDISAVKSSTESKHNSFLCSLLN